MRAPETSQRALPPLNSAQAFVVFYRADKDSPWQRDGQSRYDLGVLQRVRVLEKSGHEVDVRVVRVVTPTVVLPPYEYAGPPQPTA